MNGVKDYRERIDIPLKSLAEEIYFQLDKEDSRPAVLYRLKEEPSLSFKIFKR